ncbi:crossover junction endodeoxyribonuclease RuvC [Pseudoroseicyclus sp. CXY001]|uniref:crossover junction endodeoxyribonuclease RuvC n=1 Tax=Pseudoroseicyclus sp. CXY001 TaxID=3242492 RepID=UPI0035713F8A
MRVLGLDPGLRALGWGVIEAEGGSIRHVANGICRSGEGALAVRLLALYRQLSCIVAEYAPDAAAVEETFVNRDGAGTLKLGQARGIALLAPAEAGLEVGEYAATAIKKALVGTGRAEKAQVAHMVRMHMPGVEFAGADASDALAVAICHAHHLQSRGALAAALARAGA